VLKGKLKNATSNAYFRKSSGLNQHTFNVKGENNEGWNLGWGIGYSIGRGDSG